MTKIVINTGAGFDLTHNAIMRYAELKGIKLTAYQWNQGYGLYEMCVNLDPDKLTVYYETLDESTISTDSYREKFFSIYNIDRTDPALIQVVEELNDSENIDLKIVEVPDDVKWEITEDEMGPEQVREISKIWK